MKWTRTGKVVDAEGTTVIYSNEAYPGYTIESRKRHIPHSNGVGTWDHTTYHVLLYAKELKQLYSVRSCMSWVERMEDQNDDD